MKNKTIAMLVILGTLNPVFGSDDLGSNFDEGQVQGLRILPPETAGIVEESKDEGTGTPVYILRQRLKASEKKNQELTIKLGKQNPGETRTGGIGFDPERGWNSPKSPGKGRTD